MALARVQHTQLTAGTTNFVVPFPYISKDHIHCSVDGVDVSFSWLNPTTIQLDPAPVVGAIIDIRRETERTKLLVDFQDASTMTEVQLDLMAQQTFFIAQEAFDATGGTMAVANDGSYSANGRRISNLGYPDSDDDAANVAFVYAVFANGEDAFQQRVLAEAAKDLAQKWANNAEDLPVAQGLFSAFHHARKASQSATNAANSATEALGYRDTAEAHKNSAATSASTATTKAVEATDEADRATTQANRAESEADRSETEADRAMGYASSLDFPSASGNGGKLLYQKDDESGYGYTDIGVVDLYHSGNQLSLGTDAPTARTALGLGTAATYSDSRYLKVTGNQAMNGDFTIIRTTAAHTGVLYLGNQSQGSRYLHYDGSNYTLPGGHLYVNGYPVYTTGNLSPASYGAQVVHSSGINEFGFVSHYAGMTIDLPSPWVMTGIRTDGTENRHYIRGVWLRNQA